MQFVVVVVAVCRRRRRRPATASRHVHAGGGDQAGLRRAVRLSVRQRRLHRLVPRPAATHRRQQVSRPIKLEFRDADTRTPTCTDILARILAATRPTRAISRSYSYGEFNDTPTFSRGCRRGSPCQCRRRGMRALRDVSFTPRHRCYYNMSMNLTVTRLHTAHVSYTKTITQYVK